MSEELQEVRYYELMNYKDSKAAIKSNIDQTARSFVAIGYYLKHIRDHEMFQEDGYQSIWDLAQTEFGISKSQASKFMNINDKFSKDGNSPILLDQYKDFSSSKLSEMLYLTDEQMEQVTVGTTVAQIREIKNPEKAVSTSKQEPVPKKPYYYECAAYKQHQYSTGCKDCYYDKADCPYDRTGYFEELKRKEEWRMRCEVLKEMCDCICEMSSYILEKNSYDMDIIKGLSRKNQDFSFGFGDGGVGHSKYSAWYKAKSNRYLVEEFDGTGKWTFEAGEVDQHIWNFNSRDWHNNHSKVSEISETVNQQPKIVDNEPEIENDVDEQPKPDELVLDCYNQEGGWHKEIISDDPKEVETVDADIIQTVPEINRFKKMDIGLTDTAGDPIHEGDILLHNGDKYHVHWWQPEARFVAEAVERKYLHADMEEWSMYRISECTILESVYGKETDVINQHLEPPKPVQPELSILKNNDQRAAFIDAYTTWPIWIETKETGERYYRYDLSDGNSIVVKVYHSRLFDYKAACTKYEDRFHDGWGREEYYLLKPDKHFKDCDTNRSNLIDYLKDLQKKGV